MKITSLSNPLVKHFVKLREKRRYREEHNSLLVASKKLVEELSEKSAPKRVLTEASAAVFRKITGQPQPEGIVAEFPLPSETKELKGTHLLILDQISDPGNLGSLLRSALAFGWDGALLLPGCADPFSDKAFSASRGALFSLPFAFDKALPQTLPLLIADQRGTPFKCEEKCALVLGNEAHGSALSGERICVPQTKEMESLNVAVAGGILMRGMKRC